MKRSLVFVVAIGLSLGVFAQTQRTIATYDRVAMQALNVNTLDELLQFMPFVRVHYRSEQEFAQMGNAPVAITGVFLDGSPLMMDNVSMPNYSDISLMGIEKVELVLAGSTDLSKFTGPFLIKLTSTAIHDRPSSLGFNGGGNSRSNALFGVFGSTSTARHSFGLEFQRYFRNALENSDELRMQDLPARYLNAVGARYHGHFFGRSTVSLQYRMNSASGQQRGAVYPATVRATDRFFDRLDHRFLTRLHIPLSRTHTLEVRSMSIRTDHRNGFMDVDLNNGRRVPLPLRSIYDSTANSYTHVAAHLGRMDSSKSINFGIGIEYTRQFDRNFSSIDAIPISYVDYAIAPSFRYMENGLSMEGSMRLLSNSLLGNAVLPRFHLAYEAGHLAFMLDFVPSVFYPNNGQLFYGQDVSGLAFGNNLDLQMGRMQHVDLVLAAERWGGLWQLGTVFMNSQQAVRADSSSGRFESDLSQVNLFHFLTYGGSAGPLEIQALLALTGGGVGLGFERQGAYHGEGNFSLNYALDSGRTRLFTTYRYLGPSTYLSYTYGGMQELQAQRQGMLNIGLSRALPKGLGQLTIGVENALDVCYPTQEWSKDPYQPLAYPRPLLAQGRALFVRLHMILS